MITQPPVTSGLIFCFHNDDQIQGGGQRPEFDDIVAGSAPEPKGEVSRPNWLHSNLHETAPPPPPAPRVLDEGSGFNAEDTGKESGAADGSKSSLKRTVDAVKSHSKRALPNSVQDGVQTVSVKSKETLAQVVQTVRNPDDRELINPERGFLITGAVVAVIGLIIAIATSVNVVSAISSAFKETAAPITQPVAETPTIAAMSLLGWKAKDAKADSAAADALFDQDSGTQWDSGPYENANFGGKGGIGIAIALRAPAKISQITLTTPLKGGKIDLRSTNPSEPTSGQPIATGAFGDEPIKLAKPIVTDQLVLWIPELPKDDNGEFRAIISEITVE